MIDIVKGIEPELGYGAILRVSEIESEMRKSRIRRTKTVCTYCGVGCSFDVWTRDRHILKIEPLEDPANGISTCVKGKFGWDYVNNKDRLTKPLIREGSRFREATWDEALALVATKLAELKRDYGADSIGLIASSKCTNEEAYLMQKLARGVIGTNNVDNCSRYCQSPATMGLFRTVGYGGDSGSIKDIERASLVMIVGANTAESHPVLATRIKQSHKLRGQKLIVADLRKNEMAERADIHLKPRPNTDLVWLSAISRYLIDQGLAKMSFVDQWVNGLAEYKKSLEPFTLEFAERVSGIPAATLKQVAEMVAAADGVAICWAMGVTQHSNGSDTSTAISNLLLVTGNYMRPGTGAYPLRGHNNVQGASDMGAMPDRFPGYQFVSDPEIRARWQIIQEVANRLGAGWNYQHPSAIMDEIASLTPLFAGVTYERLEGYKSLQWPVHPDGTDEPLLFTKRFNFPDGKAQFYLLQWIEPPEQVDEEFDLHLNNGRLLEHFHEGNMTYRVNGIKQKTPDNWVEVSPELATERQIESGRWVELTSRHGRVRVRALVTDRVRGRELYMPMNSSEHAVNRLTSSVTDLATHTPAYKETPVKLKALSELGENPLPRTNFRFGTRTPQRGVEVQRKWKRADYRLPGTRNGDGEKE
jgi:predicted molibdopterin-dependent oxidoreductase YjgC